MGDEHVEFFEAVLVQQQLDPFARRQLAAGVLGIGAGAYMFKSGLDKNAEARIHTEALKELSESLNAEIQPQTIALTDRTVELSGTVEEQYRQWQELLKQIYLIDTGQASPEVIAH